MDEPTETNQPTDQPLTEEEQIEQAKRVEQFDLAVEAVTAQLNERFKQLEKVKPLDPEAEKAEKAKEELIDFRTSAFVQLFDEMEAQNIDLESQEAISIARHATQELGIRSMHRVNNLSDLKVESLSEYEFKRIIHRARKAIITITKMRQQYASILRTNEDGTVEKIGSYGPYYGNRKFNRSQIGRIFKKQRASQRSSIASKITNEQKTKRMVRIRPDNTPNTKGM